MVFSVPLAPPSCQATTVYVPVGTPLMIKLDRCRRRSERVIANLRSISQRSVFDVDESIRQLAVLDGPVFGQKVRALAGTGRVGRGVDLLGLRSGAGECNLPGDGSFVAL